VKSTQTANFDENTLNGYPFHEKEITYIACLVLFIIIKLIKIFF